MKTKTRIDEALFVIVYALWFLRAHLTTTRFIYINNLSKEKTIVTALLYITVFLLLFLGERRTIQENILSLLFFALSLLVVRNTQDITVVPTALLVICCNRIDYRKIMKVSATVMAFVLILVFFLSNKGVLQNQNWGANSNYDFGYQYCTYPGYALFFILLSLIIAYEKYCVSLCALLTILQIINFRYSDTTTTLLTSLLVFIMLLVYKFFHLEDVQLPKWLSLAPLFVSIFSYLTHYFYDATNIIWYKLNSTLIGRLYLGHNAITSYPLTLWGQHIEWVGVGTLVKNPSKKYNYVDNYFLRSLLSFGAIYFVFLLLGMCLVFYWAIKQRKNTLVIALFGLLIFGFADYEMLHPYFNSFVLLIGCAVGSLLKERGYHEIIQH